MTNNDNCCVFNVCVRVLFYGSHLLLLIKIGQGLSYSYFVCTLCRL